ncbi:MAG: hypothetical protein K9G76_03085 [Bacteroidales bacterium]|nr:hypothetical protein [Bacteroidales bacterium]MCF8402778.1 hypothetical protein [Bacteroidales bacterium]
MRILKIFLLSGILLVLLSNAGYSSKITFELIENDSYLFEYSNSYAERNSTSNFFIKELARYNLSGLYSTKYTFHYSLRESIKKIDEHTFTAEAVITGQKCTGDIFYKDFDISDILFPDKMNFTLYVNDHGNYIVNREFKNIMKGPNNEFRISFEFETFNNQSEFNLVLDAVKFYSVDEDRQKFQERISYIDDYYASLAAIDFSKNKLGSMDYTPSNIPGILLRLHESKRIYNAIYRSEFLHKLNFDAKKDEQFFRDMNAFQKKIEQVEFNYVKLVKTSEYIKFSESLTRLAEDHVNLICEFVELSNNTKHAYQPYFYKLGKSNYSYPELYDLHKSISSVLLKSKYCNDSDIVFDRFKSEIYKAYLVKAEKQIEMENFNIAKAIIESAREFYKSTLGKQTPVESNILMSKANYGIYNSYLHLIDRAIDIGNYSLAENYIEKAKNFQEINRSTIISKRQIQNASEELVNLYINKGFRQIETEEFEEAVYCFEQAQAVCSSIGVFNQDYIIKHGLIQSRNGLYLMLIEKAHEALAEENKEVAQSCMAKASDIASYYPTQIHQVEKLDELSGELAYQKYLNDISDGRKLLATGNYTMAYQKFLNALILEGSSDFAIYDPLVDLFARAATPYLVDQCKLGELKVKKNQLDEARAIYDHCFQLQSDYGLFFEKDLMASLTILNNDIFTRKCENINQEYDGLLNQFANVVESGDFITAMNILDQTNEVARDNYYCDLDKSIVVSYREMYEPAATYQELAGEAQKALQEQDQKHFNEVYEKMEELSSRYEVIRKRIEPMPLHYLFSAKKNLALLESSINNYQHEEDYATAFRILNVLEANNTSLKDTKPIQEKLAQRLACADKVNHSDSNPKVNVEKYTGGKTFYKYFKKEYIKEW